MSPTHYIFVDCENVAVSEADIDLLCDKPAHLTLFFGQQQKSLPISMVKKLLHYAGQVELAESKASTKNALDLILVSDLGVKVGKDPQGVFYIIAKDEDYKPVAARFREKGRNVSQCRSLANVPVLRGDKAKPFTPIDRDPLMQLCELYRTNRLNLPKTKKALHSQIQSSLSPKVDADKALGVMQGLIKLGMIVVTANDKVEFVGLTEQPAPSNPLDPVCLLASASS